MILDIIFDLVKEKSWLELVLIFVFSVVPTVIAIIGLLLNNKKCKKIENKIKEEEEKMKKNKNTQNEEEEELKEMAIFLCDRCGAKVEVKNATLYKDYALCCDCASYIKNLENELSVASREYDVCTKEYTAAKQKLNDAINRKKNIESKMKINNCDKTNCSDENCNCQNENQDNILSKLGINGSK